MWEEGKPLCLHRQAVLGDVMKYNNKDIPESVCVHNVSEAMDVVYKLVKEEHINGGSVSIKIDNIDGILGEDNICNIYHTHNGLKHIKKFKV